MPSHWHRGVNLSDRRGFQLQTTAAIVAISESGRYEAKTRRFRSVEGQVFYDEVEGRSGCQDEESERSSVPIAELIEQRQAVTNCPSPHPKCESVVRLLRYRFICFAGVTIALSLPGDKPLPPVKQGIKSMYRCLGSEKESRRRILFSSYHEALMPTGIEHKRSLNL